MSRLAPRVRVARVVSVRARRASARVRASSADAPSSAARVASLRAILGLDDRALQQLDHTVEGRAVRDDVPLSVLTERVYALSSALPRACARHAFELAVERRARRTPWAAPNSSNGCARSARRRSRTCSGAWARAKGRWRIASDRCETGRRARRAGIASSRRESRASGGTC